MFRLFFISIFLLIPLTGFAAGKKICPGILKITKSESLENIKEAVAPDLTDEQLEFLYKYWRPAFRIYYVVKSQSSGQLQVGVESGDSFDFLKKVIQEEGLRGIELTPLNGRPSAF